MGIQIVSSLFVFYHYKQCCNEHPCCHLFVHVFLSDGILGSDGVPVFIFVRARPAEVSLLNGPVPTGEANKVVDIPVTFAQAT